MIRHFEVGDWVYYTGDRTREIYEVTHKPTKAYHRYRIRALDPDSKRETIDLPSDEDSPIWDCIFKFDDHVAAKNDAVRRQNEYNERVNREVEDWAALTINEPEILMQNLYMSWKYRMFFVGDYDAETFKLDYIPLNFHVPEVVEARERLIRQRIRQYWGIDIKKE